MKEKLEAIVGKNVLNGESSSSVVVKMAKALNYLNIQLKMMKNLDEEYADHIDGVLNSAEEILSSEE